VDHDIVLGKTFHQMLINLGILGLQIQILKSKARKTEIKGVQSSTGVGRLYPKHRITFQVNVAHGDVAGVRHNYIALLAQIKKLRPGTDIEEVTNMAAFN